MCMEEERFYLTSDVTWTSHSVCVYARLSCLYVNGMTLTKCSGMLLNIIIQGYSSVKGFFSAPTAPKENYQQQNDKNWE